VRHALNRLDVGLTDLVAVQTTLGYYGKNHKTITSAPLRLWHEVPNRYAPIAAFYAAGVAATAAENYQTLFSLCEAPAPGAVRRAPFVSRAAEYFVSVNDQLVAEESDSSRLALSDRLHATLRSIHDRVLRLETNFDLAFDRFEALWWLQNADHAADKEGVVSQALPPPGRFAAAAGTSFVEELIEEARHAEGSRWPPLTAGLCGGKRDRFTRLAEHLINAIEEFLTLRLVIKARPALPWEVQIAQSKTLDSLWAKILWSPEWPDSQERTRSVLFGVAGIQPRYVLVDERSLPAYATAAHESRRHALIVAATEGETSISRTSTLSLKECGLENGATLVVCDRETGLPATFAE
jgi:hypothetical protein